MAGLQSSLSAGSGPAPPLLPGSPGGPARAAGRGPPLPGHWPPCQHRPPAGRAAGIRAARTV